ncbi:MAG TPA: flavin prenyltransferase UbiX [Thermoguttaceae bacterium]|nr:flavin prenyltransferase UbiX [Thermoguttaceae bacterium]
MKRNFVVAVTGASGVAYAIRLIEVLTTTGCDVQLSISQAAVAVLAEELHLKVNLDRFTVSMLGIEPDNPARQDERLKKLRNFAGIASEQSSVLSVGGRELGQITYHDCRDFTSPLASGSHPTDGMIVCPCSAATLGSIASGAATNLIHRAAEVHLKQRRPLVLVPRETPLSMIFLDNMRRAAEAGAVILPAVPGFYHGPKTVQDLIDFVVARICGQLGVATNLVERAAGSGQ